MTDIGERERLAALDKAAKELCLGVESEIRYGDVADGEPGAWVQALLALAPALLRAGPPKEDK